MANLLDAAGGRLRRLDLHDQTVASSNIDGFDQALGRQLVRLSKTFNVRPGFAYVNDAADRNAIASSLSRFPGTQGTVLMGIRFMTEMLHLGNGGDIAVLGVCAHEFGHIVQFRTGAYSRLVRGQPTRKLMELHADYMAGFFIGVMRHLRPQIVTRTFEVAFERMGSQDKLDPDFHGTPAERLASVQAGIKLAESGASFETCHAQGEIHVRANYG